MSRTEALRQFSRQLTQFTSAGALLAEAWETLANVDDRLSVEVGKKYPFRDDFMETLLDIGKWNAWVKSRLTLGPKDWRP